MSKPTMLKGIAALTALSALGACASLNERDTLGAHEPVEALDSASAVRVQAMQTSPTLTMDRSNWSERVYAVPVDGVLHQPTGRFVRMPAAGARSWRDKGDYPTAEKALDVDGSAGFEVSNLFLEPLGGGLEIAATPVGLIVAPPWKTVQTPKVDVIAPAAAPAEERAE